MGASVNDLARGLIDELGLDPVAAAGSDKLHKLLYYVQGHCAAATGEPLFSEAIEAGDSGPVVAGFGRVELDAPRGELDDVALGWVRYVAGRYGRLSILDLQNLTKAEPPWQIGRGLPGRRVALGDMIAYFRGGGAPLEGVQALAPSKPEVGETTAPRFQPGEATAVSPDVPTAEAAAASPGAPATGAAVALPGVPPGGQATTTPRPAVGRRRPWIVVGIVYTVVIGLAGLVVIGGLVAKNARDGGTGGTTVKNAGRVGEPVRDGDFEFTVTELECGRTTLGDGVFSSPAPGDYCLVTLAVRNVGARARPFDESSQKAYDEKGTRYLHDAEAEFQANFGVHAWFKEIEPGGQVAGRLVFDMPDSRSLTSIELHYSADSGGVKVPLR